MFEGLGSIVAIPPSGGSGALVLKPADQVEPVAGGREML